jgi:hypothetical protein
MENEKDEIIDPLLDTGKAAREALRIANRILALAEKIDQREAESAEWRKRQEEKERKPKIDGWKFLRGIAAKIVGDIDNLSK